MDPGEYAQRIQSIASVVLRSNAEIDDDSCDASSEDDSVTSLTKGSSRNPERCSKDVRIYSYSPSNCINVACEWTLRDPYERLTVACRPSELPNGAGDGLFALRDIPEKTIIAYYNGIRVLPGESYTTTSAHYQIYVDWVNTDDSPYIDIPKECVDANSYCASLAHKANHGFKPNCRYSPADHPV